MTASPPPFRVALIGECMIELKETAAGALSRGFGGDTFNTGRHDMSSSRDAAPTPSSPSPPSSAAAGDSPSAARAGDRWRRAAGRPESSVRSPYRRRP